MLKKFTEMSAIYSIQDNHENRNRALKLKEKYDSWEKKQKFERESILKGYKLKKVK